jgi:hypothetical protein
MVISHIFFYIKSVIKELLLRWIFSYVVGFLNGVNTPAGDGVAKRILAVKGSVLGFETNPVAWFVTKIRVSEQQDLGTLSFGGLGKPISRFTSSGVRLHRISARQVSAVELSSFQHLT